MYCVNRLNFEGTSGLRVASALKVGGPRSVRLESLDCDHKTATSADLLELFGIRIPIRVGTKPAILAHKHFGRVLVPLELV